MTVFSNFSEFKKESILIESNSYRSNCISGTHPITSRQPPVFHAYLDYMERYIPGTSRAEILFEAVKSAFCEILGDKELDGTFQLDLTAYFLKSCKAFPADGEMEMGTAYTSDEAKGLADDYFNDRKTLSTSELIEKYSSFFSDFRGV